MSTVRTFLIAILLGFGYVKLCFSQDCHDAGIVLVTVLDPDGAVVTDGRVTVKGMGKELTKKNVNDDRAYAFPCLATGTYQVTVLASGFEEDHQTVHVNTAHLHVQIAIPLKLASVETNVAISGDDDALSRAAGATILSQQQLSGFAEDPDDFATELQQLAIAAGGAPGKAIVTVNGFQNASTLPPKSSIQEIRINPDMFSAEYATPPYAGGRIEVYTKSGQDKFHGSLFSYYSDAGFNARDPLALSSTPAAKQRYGFSLDGPLLSRKRADFSLDLEERHINENATIHATVLDNNGSSVSYNTVIGTPQELWIGNAQTGWQLGSKDTFIASFSTNTNDLANKGVGGLVLPEAGYDSYTTEYDLRFVNSTFLSPKLFHATHLGISWKALSQNPASDTPSLQVAGAFTSGGSPSGNTRTRERDVELDDDLLISSKAHTIKIGLQSLGAFIGNDMPQGFNGIFTFGGGSAPALDNTGTAIPGSSIVISGLEQYRRALAGLPGGNPTTYSVTQGNIFVPLTQWTVALHAQDQWKIDPRVSIALGLRYFAQTSPSILGSWAPRLGVAWSPDRKQSWVIHGRVGLFYDSIASTTSIETVRLNGSRQQTTTLYSPIYSDPLGSGAATPPIGEFRRFSPGLTLSPSVQTQLSVEHTFFKKWQLNANVYYATHWDVLRSRNINAPMVTDASINPLDAPRPLEPNLNLFEYQPTGRIEGPLAFIGLNRFSRNFSLISGYLYNGLRSNADTPDTFPQTSYSDRGDYSRPAWLVSHSLFAVIIATLPLKLASTTNLSISSGFPYDITTGFDNNGDGVFNDRPSLATASDTEDVYPTRFGLLTTATLNGNLDRDRGTMPLTVHLDTSLGRDFGIGEKVSGGKRKYVLRLEARSSNLLNHANYTGVDGIVGTSQFGQPITADFGRRVELGIRGTF